MRGAYSRRCVATEGDQPRWLRGRMWAVCDRVDEWAGWDLASTGLMLASVLAAGCACALWLLSAGAASTPCRALLLAASLSVCKLMF